VNTSRKPVDISCAVEISPTGNIADMTGLVIAIAVVIALVVGTYAWGRRLPASRIKPRRGDAVQRRREERDLL
jgi:hypothetical protein